MLCQQIVYIMYLQNIFPRILREGQVAYLSYAPWCYACRYHKILCQMVSPHIKLAKVIAYKFKLIWFSFVCFACFTYIFSLSERFWIGSCYYIRTNKCRFQSTLQIWGLGRRKVRWLWTAYSNSSTGSIGGNAEG